MKTKKLFFAGIAIAICAAFLDLLSKKIIFDILNEIAAKENTDSPEIVVSGFFSLVQVWNRGVSFGMFNSLENGVIILSTLQIAIIICLLVWLYRNQNQIMMIAIGLIIGGAFGNLIDRLMHKAVADFLDFYIYDYHWPAFNLADSFVFVGVAMLIIFDLIKPKEVEKK